MGKMAVNCILKSNSPFLIYHSSLPIMKKKIVLMAVLFAFTFLSCKKEVKYGAPIVQTDIILKDIMSFLTYRQTHIRLYEDFVGLDTASNMMSKAAFYKLFATGDYFPLRLSSTDSLTYYKLQKLDAGTNNDIVQTVKNWAIREYNYYLLEGTALPNYSFIDLDGRTYTPESTKGKIVVLKCWFLNCMPCVVEIPTLNRIKGEYEGRDDILFLSLCLDSPLELKAFLAQNVFDYKQIGDQNNYLSNKLKIDSYPTHFVINKKGLILKKTNKYEEMASILKKEAGKM